MPGFDIGHLILLSAIALVVFGPERLGEIMRTAGHALAEFRRASQGLPALWEPGVPAGATADASGPG